MWKGPQLEPLGTLGPEPHGSNEKTKTRTLWCKFVILKHGWPNQCGRDRSAAVFFQKIMIILFNFERPVFSDYERLLAIFSWVLTIFNKVRNIIRVFLTSFAIFAFENRSAARDIGPQRQTGPCRTGSCTSDWGRWIFWDWHFFSTLTIVYLCSSIKIPYFTVKSNTKSKSWGLVIKEITVIIRSLMEHEGKL